MQSPIPTNYALPRPSYQTAHPFFFPNRSGSIRRPVAVPSCQSYWRRCCGVKIACGIRSRDQNLQIQSPKDSESSIDPATDARYSLSSAVNDQQTPSAGLLQPLTKTDLSQPRAPMQELRLHVAYQGFPGSYSEVATGWAYPNCEAIPCDLFKTVFKAVELGVVDRGIIPIENSIGGLIHANYDLLLENHLYVVGEVNLPIHQCLLALPGVRFEHLSRVIAHPVSLAQCEHNLIKLIPAATYEAVDDSAGAAQYIAANKLRDTAAITSSRAAEIFGLQVLADSIGDDSSNVTRFLKLARELFVPVTDWPLKTTIVITHDQGADILFGMLSTFESRGIILTKIVTWPRRSRPIRIASEVTKEQFECLSYLDVVASIAEERMQDALSEVRKVGSFPRVLGSYPMEVMPAGWQ